MAILSARGLSKAYGPQTLFTNASLAIQEGDRVGLLGANGMGKSTFLRVLARLDTPDEGVIEVKRGASVLYLPQEPKLPPGQTPRQLVEEGLREWHAACARHAEVTARIASGEATAELLTEQAALSERIEHLGGWEQGHLAAEMLLKLGVHEIDREVGSMSGGEQRRVALAKILVAQPELAILDEPTNHLDVETIEYLEEYLSERFHGSVMLVTHDRYVLDAVSTRVFELEHGELAQYTGDYSDYLEQKAELLAHAERHESNRLNQVRRERAWLLRGAKARTTKQKARIKRAETLMAIEPPKQSARAELRGLEAGASQGGKTILEFHGLDMALGARTLIAGLTLHMVQGERLGIVGPNGAGKTTLLKLVAGELTPTAGTVVLGARTKLAYFDQARSNLRDDWSVFDNVAERQGAERDGGGQVVIGDLTLDMRSYLERFLFDGGKQRQKVAALSGGERARVALAKALRGGANLLLLDEPTNDLDIATLGELEELLASWPGCALVVSHDRAFLNRVVTSVLAFEPGGKLVRYSGNYNDYREQRATAVKPDASAQNAKKTASNVAPAKAPAPAKKKPLTYGERLELEGILDKISAAEAELARITASLSNPATYSAGESGRRQIESEFEKAREAVAKLTTRWEELEARSSANATR